MIRMNQVRAQHQTDSFAINIGHVYREKVLDSRADLVRHLVKALAHLNAGGTGRFDRRRHRLEPVARALYKDGDMHDEAR